MPKTTYFYRINNENSVRTFKTAPLPGDSEPFSVGIVGDLGLVNSKNTISGLAGHANDTDFYWLIGGKKKQNQKKTKKQKIKIKIK